MRIGPISMIACLLVSINCWADAEEVAPTPTTLEKWLEDKEVVEVRFTGPYMEPLKLRDSMKTKVPDNDLDFRLTPGEGGGTNGSFIIICMKVTPDNIRRLLAVQKELKPRNYRLDPPATRIWSYRGDGDTRAKARAMVPEFLAAVERCIKNGIPKVQCSSQKGELQYEIPGTDVRGMIRVSEITPVKNWEGAAIPDQKVHLPHLGLMIASYYRPGKIGALEDISLHRNAIRKAFSQSVQSLLKLEPDAVVSCAIRIVPISDQ